MTAIESHAIETGTTAVDVSPCLLDSKCTWKDCLWAMPWLLCTILLTVIFPPVFARDANLDLSYAFGIDYAFIHHLRFGIDFVSTFGPWGFAYYNIYEPQVMGWMVFAQATIGFGLFAGLWKLGRNLRIPALFTGIWVVFVTVWGNLTLYDGRYLAICALPMLIRRTSPNRRDSWASAIVVGTLALAGLSKFIFFALAAGSIGLLSLEDILRRRPPLLGIWFITALTLFWRLAGQGIADLPVYLQSAFRLSSGYSEAMGGPGPDAYMMPIVVIISIGLAGSLLVRFWKENRIGATIGGLTIAATCFMCFKEGFVRHDAHEFVATTGLATLALMLLPIFWIRSTHWLRTISLLLLFASTWSVTKTYKRFLPQPDLGASLMMQPAIMEDRLQNGWRWMMKGNRIFDDDFETGMASVREEGDLPLRAGTVDFYGLHPLTLMATNMHYQPRPVSPGFEAWSPKLIEMNRQSLLGDRAPQSIFFNPGCMDGRFPSLDDGALWPLLMSRYLPTEIGPKGVLVLDRLAEPRPFTITPISSGKFKLGERIPVPLIPNGIIWMKIKIGQTLLGRLGTILLRMPDIYLRYTTTDGRTDRRRIIPGMTEEGFVLSPVVNDASDFLSMSVHPNHLPQVKEVLVRDSHLGWIKHAFASEIEVSFSRLEVSPFSPQDTTSVEELANLREMSLNTDNPAGILFFKEPRGQWALLAHPPMHLQLESPPQATKIHLTFGIRPEVWDKTKGVVFLVSAVTADGAVHPLLNQTMQPQTNETDRREIQTDLALPPTTARLLFETRSTAELGYCWGYWSDVRFN